MLLSTVNDATSIQRIKDGDEKAFHELYRLHRDSFLDWVSFSYSISKEDSKDIYQEAFLILWRNIHEGRLTELSSSIKTYIYSVGKHLAINFIKKHGRTVTSEPIELINLSYHPFEMSEDREHNRKLIEENLSKLAEKDRKILELYYMDGKDMKTIAKEMGYKNADVAKKKKYEVFKKLATMVKSGLKTLMLV
ncbi:MAG: RNA polymerase sigma factor [Bacteroidia bacterium]